MSNSCAICKNPSEQSCSLCNEVFYCSKDHQRQDWKNHKPKCAPYKIVTSLRLGRHLVATRDIPQNAIIMKKFPLLIAPKMASFPVCLGCHKRLQNDFHECPKCSWPLCSKTCESSGYHQHECEVFSRKNYTPRVQRSNTKQGIYSLIAPMRALILKTRNKSQFESLLSMQSHLEDNQNSPIYRMLKASLVPIFRGFGIGDPEEILTICSIFDTNSFEIRDTKGLVNIRGLYPMVSLISHDCKINTKHSFHGDNHEIHVIATVPIKKGEILTTTYTQTLWCTAARRAHLKQAKNFDCTCSRCEDPTEYGTFAGSIICTNCHNGLVVSEDPLDVKAGWKCDKCNHLLGHDELDSLNEVLRREVYCIDRSDPENFENFLKKYKDVLHETNCHVLEVKYALTQMYGNLAGFKLEELPEDLLKRKIDLCEELIQIADKLEPGSSRFRGNLLDDLQAALAEKTFRELKTDDPNLNKSKEVFKRCFDLLEMATEILETEPETEQHLKRQLENLLAKAPINTKT
ncbi:PREDICTED: protein msta [Nicrophorus vespilloides]|uniref:Protein msta n=1 Tax=Nicrophorus vespilloides TaxID=110193 RepID=A0ABM1N7V5_NICVS|nr:PREDICTED: protein msta [Nicrophorus vespilloides]